MLGRSDGGPSLREIPISDIRPNPHQPRMHFEEESLADLAASIRQIGVLQPILVRPADGGFELIAGERRWRAATRAGLATIPAVIRVTDDMSSVEQALVENLHRQDLTPLEEAAAYNQLIEDFSLTHEQVAERVGKSRSAVTNTLRLLGLPPAVQHLLADGRLSGRHARTLLSTSDRALQERLAQQAVEEGWTVRALEVALAGDPEPAVSDTADGDGPSSDPIDGAGISPITRLRPAAVLEVEGRLANRLDTRVKVTMGAARGRIVIEFADLGDLERIYGRMSGDN
ncbi:MAG: ParB/RepB/Spo0J family partition protein [Ilumatobacteraceae bacterium]